MKQRNYTRPCDREDVAFKAAEIYQVGRKNERREVFDEQG